jgi:hypothetical protein
MFVHIIIPFNSETVGVDVKLLREQKREHLKWIRKREFEMKHQSKRRKKYSVL